MNAKKTDTESMRVEAARIIDSNKNLNANSIDAPDRGSSTHTSIRDDKKLEIKFLSEIDDNFLLMDAPPAPILVNVQKGDDVQPFIYRGIIGQLVGAGGVGKTHMLSQLALSIATGTNFLTKFTIPNPGHVFLALGENSDDDIRRLLHKLGKCILNEQELILAGKHLAVMSLSGTPASFIERGKPTKFFYELLEELKSKEPNEGWACIILDPMSRVLGAEAENDNAAATQFIALVERFTQELRGKPTVLFGHHMSKAGMLGETTDQTAARGSSAITDGVRWQANLYTAKKNDIEQIKLKVVKTNFTQKPSNDYDIERDDHGCLHIKKESKIVPLRDNSLASTK